MRKIFTFITALLLGAMMTANAAAVGDVFTVDGVQYKVTSIASGAEKVSVPVQDYTGSSLVIPAKVTYDAVEYTVYMVEQNAFKNNKTITSLDVAASVINSWAFEACSNLADVTLREGVRTLYRDAFEGFAATSITLPESLVEIDEYGYYCPFPDNQLESIVVAAGNPHFVVGEDGALYNTERTRIYAFPHNFSKKFKEIPSTVEIIYDDVFSDCTNISDTIIIPATLQRAHSFRRCSSIKCVILESNSMNVSNCFTYCSNLEEIIIGKNVTPLGQLLFYGSCNVRKITVLSETMPNWQYGTSTSWPVFGNYSYCGGVISPFTDAKVYVHCGQSATYAADADKWANFTNFVDTLLYDVNVEADNADVVITKLSDCNKVNIAVTPKSGYAFVNWDNGVTTASFDCTVTSDTTITAVIKRNLVKNDMFTAKTVEGVPVLYKVLTNAAGDKTVQVGNYWYATQPAIDKNTTGAVTIPDSAVYFDEKFEVVALDIHAFFDCQKITALHLPNTIKKMGAAAISDNFALTEVNIPTGLIDPGTSNYNYLSVLESITIPSTLKYWGYSLFIGCYNLATINGWNPSQFERVGSAGGSNVAKFFTLKQNVDTVGAYIYAGDILYDNVYPYSSTEITTIKEGTRVVSGEAGGQSNSKHVIFPASVEAIGIGALGNEPMLQTCTIKAVTPPLVYCSYDVTVEMTANKFGWSKSSCTDNTTTTPDLSTVNFYVPKAAVAAYKANAKWNMLDIRPIGGWTVSFRDHNGNNIIAPQNVEQGTAANRPASVETYYTASYMYEFAGTWTTTIVNTGDTLYDAVYNQLPLPKHYVCFYETEADALAKTNRKYRVEKTHFESAAENAITAAGEIAKKECQMITGWNGGDITNVTAELHVWPTWGDGKYKVTFFDPIGATAIKTYENQECGDGVDAPDAALIPTHAGKKFDHWDTDAWKILKNMLGDLTVNAVYVDDPGTGMESVQNSEIINQKLLIDGQIYILRGEKVYTITGQEVK